jgi:hypothetical protein
VTKQARRVRRLTRKRCCIRCASKLTPRELAQARRCLRCRRDEAAKAKARYWRLKAETAAVMS